MLTHRVDIFDQTTERGRHAARMSAVERVIRHVRVRTDQVEQQVKPRDAR
jgi:hypothetical protein